MIIFMISLSLLSVVYMYVRLCRYCTPWLILATTVPRRMADNQTIYVCMFRLPRNRYLAYYLADLVLFYATPLLTASVLYALIARRLLCRTGPVAHSRSRRSTADNSETTTATYGTAAASTAGDGTSSNVQVLSTVYLSC